MLKVFYLKCHRISVALLFYVSLVNIGQYCPNLITILRRTHIFPETNLLRWNELLVTLV